MFVSEKEPPEKPLATDGENIHDRRRPGRVNFRNPWLIALLRGNFKSPTRILNLTGFRPRQPSHEKESQGQLQPRESGFDSRLEVF